MPTRRSSQLVQFLGRLTFKRIPRREVVIYDAFSQRHLYPLLNMSRVAVLDVEFHEINAWVLIYSLRFGRPNARSYLFAFLSLTAPRVVITTCDNSVNFYTIKDKFPHIVTISIQNGRRNTFGPRKDSSFQFNLSRLHQRPQVDMYFTFGTTEHDQFKHLIDAHFIAHGNLKNNYFANLKTSSSSGRQVMSYISSFPNLNSGTPSSVDSEIPTHFFRDKPISHRSYFEPEGRISRFLAHYCRERDIKFQIIGKQESTSPHESEYFKEQVGDQLLSVVPCTPEGASYRALLESDYVVSIDSTLAYEMFGRGMRTAFLTIRGSAIGIDGVRCTNFGFPRVTDETGAFWTNIDDQGEFLRVLNFVVTSSNIAWEEEALKFRPVVMDFDPHNSTLYGVLTDLGVSHGLGETEIQRRAREIYGVG